VSTSGERPGGVPDPVSFWRDVYQQTEHRHRTPLLLIYAPINKPYVLDLYPGNSFVEHMVQQGFDVYLLD
jgi:poly(3-hydroxyalkanoate) synthetase